MRKFKTRKGPPPQKNVKLSEAMQEMAQLMVSRSPAAVQADVIDITIDIPPMETPNAVDKTKASS